MPNPSRSERYPDLRIEAESAEPPPRHGNGGDSAARPVNDKAPVTFDEGLELRIHNQYEPFLTVQCRNFGLKRLVYARRCPETT